MPRRWQLQAPPQRGARRTARGLLQMRRLQLLQRWLQRQDLLPQRRVSAEQRPWHQPRRQRWRVRRSGLQRQRRRGQQRRRALSSQHARWRRRQRWHCLRAPRRALPPSLPAALQRPA
jgi:hypothetical protein